MRRGIGIGALVVALWLVAVAAEGWVREAASQTTLGPDCPSGTVPYDTDWHGVGCRADPMRR